MTALKTAGKVVLFLVGFAISWLALATIAAMIVYLLDGRLVDAFVALVIVVVELAIVTGIGFLVFSGTRRYP